MCQQSIFAPFVLGIVFGDGLRDYSMSHHVTMPLGNLLDIGCCDHTTMFQFICHGCRRIIFHYHETPCWVLWSLQQCSFSKQVLQHVKSTQLFLCTGSLFRLCSWSVVPHIVIKVPPFAAIAAGSCSFVINNVRHQLFLSGGYFNEEVAHHICSQA